MDFRTLGSRLGDRCNGAPFKSGVFSGSHTGSRGGRRLHCQKRCMLLGGHRCDSMALQIRNRVDAFRHSEMPGIGVPILGTRMPPSASSRTATVALIRSNRGGQSRALNPRRTANDGRWHWNSPAATRLVGKPDTEAAREVPGDKRSRDFYRVIPPSLESLLRRFFLGTDGVAPVDQRQYLRVFYQPGPLWNLLNKNASEKVCKLNYERIFY